MINISMNMSQTLQSRDLSSLMTINSKYEDKMFTCLLAITEITL